MRRVVTGEDAQGRSAVVIDEAVEESVSYAVPGMVTYPLWATDPARPFDRSGRDPIPRSEPRMDLPPAGGTRFLCLRLPPDAVLGAPDFDGAAAAAEQSRLSPRLAAAFTPDRPGVHRTDTIDCTIVLQGTLVLELDDGEVELHQGDVLVQNGTRHAWRNRTDEPALLGIVWVGPDA